MKAVTTGKARRKLATFSRDNIHLSNQEGMEGYRNSTMRKTKDGKLTMGLDASQVISSQQFDLTSSRG